MNHLEPLPYHRRVVSFVQDHMPSVWAHYANASLADRQAHQVELHLLQHTVTLTRESYPELYATVDKVAAALEIDVPITVYQSETSDRLGAALYFHPTRASVELHGAVLDRLDEDELSALLAHELAHHLLWIADAGVYFATNQLLEGLLSMSGPHGSAPHTMRLFNLHTEVFCDRAALQVVTADAAIRMLVKMRTGLSRVVSADFVEQSEKLLAEQGAGSRGWTHPEAHLRALALARFDSDTDFEIQPLLEGPLQLSELDMTRRDELDAHTGKLVGHVLQHGWFRTEAIIGHLRLLFDDDLPPFEPWDTEPSALDHYGESVKHYLAAVLLDFVVLDPDLGDLPLQRCHQVAEWLGIHERFEAMVNKELKRTKKSIAAALMDRDSDIAAANEAPPTAEETPE